MKAFRDRYASIEKQGAEVIAISMDDRETLAKFKRELGAPFSFVSDADGRIATQFGVRDPGDRHASRKTFVIGEGRKVLAVEAGMFAIDPDEAIAACPLRPRKPAPAPAPATTPQTTAKPAPDGGTR